MCSCFGYYSFFKHNDLIGILYRTESVRYDDNCFPLKECTKVIHYRLFVCSIQGIRRFIEKDKIGFLVDCPCNKQSLLLAGAQSLAVVPDPCMVTQRKTVDILLNICSLCRPVCLFLIGHIIGKTNVAGYRIGENITLLHYNATSLSPF